MMSEKNKLYQEQLNKCLKDALEKETSIMDESLKYWLDTTLKNSERKKGVLTVVVTSLVKKIVNPKQDIRLHQANMTNGYSGRTLDTNIITPFFKKNKFPAMSESGWLTRSLEQNQSYDLKYRGAIKPSELKKSFLQILDSVEKGTSPRPLLIYILRGLIANRDMNVNLKLAKPINLSISDIVFYLNKHFTKKYTKSGASRLPVLAIYAAYQQMCNEVGRYKKCKLKELESHTSPDKNSGAVGDIEILDENSKLFEAIEIKHQKVVDVTMISDAYKKFQTETIKRYYLLTTSEKNNNDIENTKEILRISRSHGCQVIVNGVLDTLKYYLRLLNNPSDFIGNYVCLLEKETAITFEHKEEWNNIIAEGVSTK